MKSTPQASLNPGCCLPEATKRGLISRAPRQPGFLTSMHFGYAKKLSREKERAFCSATKFPFRLSSFTPLQFLLARPAASPCGSVPAGR